MSINFNVVFLMMKLYKILKKSINAFIKPQNQCIVFLTIMYKKTSPNSLADLLRRKGRLTHIKAFTAAFVYHIF